MNNLRIIREKRKITQTRLSIELEVSQEAISAYESNKALPSAETLIKMANYFNTSIDYLLDLTDNEIPYLNNYKVKDEDILLSIYNRLNDKAKEEVVIYAKIREKFDE